MQPKLFEYATKERLKQWLRDIVAPKKGERLLFISDASGKEKEMADENFMLCRFSLAALELSREEKFTLLPIVKINGGTNSLSWPADSAVAEIDDLGEYMRENADIVVNFAAIQTSELFAFAKDPSVPRERQVRIVTMDDVVPEMLPALHADYNKITERGLKLEKIVRDAIGFEISFFAKNLPPESRLYVDTRNSKWLLDSGLCREKGTMVQMPSGELFTAPYDAQDNRMLSVLGNSRTEGIWPMFCNNKKTIVVAHVKNNRITEVEGENPARGRGPSHEGCHFGWEQGRCMLERYVGNGNVAELAFGLNPNARVGLLVPVREAEKSGGIHIAYGSNHFFGGNVKSGVHRDIVYSSANPIKADVYAVYPDGTKKLIVKESGLACV